MPAYVSDWYVMATHELPQSNAFGGKSRATNPYIKNSHVPTGAFRASREIKMKAARKSRFDCEATAFFKQILDSLDSKPPRSEGGVFWCAW
jgi:hypothetical protein